MKISKNQKINLNQQYKNSPKNNITLSKALEIYLQHKQISTKSSSYHTIYTNLKHLEHIKNCKIQEISPLDIFLLIQNMQKGKKTYLSMQKNLKAFFNFCVKTLKIIDENPVNIVKKQRIDNRKKYIDKNLYEKIINEIKNKDAKLFIKILYNTGMRISEVRGLKQDDIQDNIITVSRQIYKKNLQDLKTANSYRQIPIDTKLYKEIKNHNSTSEYIFSKNIDIYSRIQKYGISPHCFRYTYATNLVAKGINLKVASEILGDEFDTFTKIYVQPSTDIKLAEFKKIMHG